MFSEINIEENVYELSIDLKTNGYAEGNLYVSESGYSSVIDNEAMLGFSTDIEMNDIYNPENIVLKYKIKDNYIDNTLGIYSDYEEFQGIKRLNVFKFNEDTNMLLPVETKFDIENNTLYAEVDELGTYCLMDLEIWLNSLGINVPEESVSEENSILKKSSNQSTSSWTPEYTNAPIDLVFLIDSSGKYKNKFEQEKNIVINFCKYVFDNYNNIRVHIITSTSYSSDIINSNNGINWFTSYDEVKTALNSINYTYDNSTLESNNKFTKVLNDVTLRNGSDIFIYSLYNHGYFQSSNSDLGSLAFCKMNIGIYSEILPKNWHYQDLNYQKDVETEINNNNGLFIELDENTLHSIINNFNENLSPVHPVYEILLPTSWKKITLNGELSPTNNIDTDGDSLTDWQEVDTSRLIWNEDGSFEMPTLDIYAIILQMNRFNSDFGKEFLSDTDPRYYLPIISDPTMVDSDSDGLNDGQRQYYCDKVLLPIDPNPLKYDGPEGIWLAQKNRLNDKTNPIPTQINAPQKNMSMQIMAKRANGLVKYLCKHEGIINEKLINGFKEKFKKTSKNKTFAKAGAEFLEFTLDKENIAYHSHENNWQKAFGYNDLYDQAFDYGSAMEKNKVTFEYDEEKYVLWSWKGDYWNLGGGAETGLYVLNNEINRNKGYDVDHYNVASTQLKMTLSLYKKESDMKKPENVFIWVPEENQWWITGFNTKYEFPNPNDMVMICSVDFSVHSSMYKSFKNNYKSNNNNAIFIFDDEKETVWLVW